MNELEDIKLNALLHELQLEKPGPNFSARVMNKIFEENPAFDQLKSQPILGKGFWIISALFVCLLVVMFMVSGTGTQTGSPINNLLPEISSGVSTGFKSFFEKIGMVPLSIAGILIASSVLLFIDRLISSNSRVFSQI